MKTKRILMFGTYPIVNAQHGGQYRVHAIMDGYKRQGLKVKYIAIFQRNFYLDMGTDDIALSQPLKEQTLKEVYTSDVSVGKRLYEEEIIRRKVVASITAFNPDIIEIEQVFPYFGLQRLLKDIGWSGKLIYSSQNIEYQLKNMILSDSQVTTEEKEAAVLEIKNIEIQLAKDADLVIACTQDDADYFKRQGSKDVVVAQNGIEHRYPSPSSIKALEEKFAKSNIEHPVLFIGSAHPPNVNGFTDMVGYGLGFLPPNARLLLLGGVSDLIKQKLNEQPNYIRETFEMRADFLGRVNEEELAAHLHLSDIIILPITEGGGSNLKTAEAILADTKIVATPHALRSFEAFEELPNISIVATQDLFRAAIANAVSAEKKPRTAQQNKLAEGVTWSNTLNEAIRKVVEL